MVGCSAGPGLGPDSSLSPQGSGPGAAGLKLKRRGADLSLGPQGRGPSGSAVGALAPLLLGKILPNGPASVTLVRPRFCHQRPQRHPAGSAQARCQPGLCCVNFLPLLALGGHPQCPREDVGTRKLGCGQRGSGRQCRQRLCPPPSRGRQQVQGTSHKGGRFPPDEATRVALKQAKGTEIRSLPGAETGALKGTRGLLGDGNSLHLDGESGFRTVYVDPNPGLCPEMHVLLFAD